MLPFTFSSVFSQVTIRSVFFSLSLKITTMLKRKQNEMSVLNTLFHEMSIKE